MTDVPFLVHLFCYYYSTKIENYTNFKERMFIMKSCYVLIEETNLRKPPKFGLDKIPERTFRVFSDFETAKKGMRYAIKVHATHRNGLFDGYGYIRGFRRDWDKIIEEYLDCDDVVEIFKKTPEMMKAYFLGEDENKIFDKKFFDVFDTCEFELSDCNCGWFASDLNIEREIVPFNFFYYYNPLFMQINSFCMDNPEKVYVFRIRGACDNCEQPRFVHLELRKVYIE